MKHPHLYILIFCFSIGLSSCKSDTNSNATTEDSELMTPEQVPQAPETVTEELSINELTEKNWEIRHISKNGQMQSEDPQIGSILSFDGEGNYVWKGNGVDNEGRWAYDQENVRILLESSKPEFTSEWNVKYKRSVMVWIGTAKHGHNNIQMMLNHERTVGK